MGYCCRCGVYADLDDAKMCGTCRRDWRPAGDRPRDLGARGQPQPLPVVQDGRQLGQVRRQDIAVDVVIGQLPGPRGPVVDPFVGRWWHPADLIQELRQLPDDLGGGHAGSAAAAGVVVDDFVDRVRQVDDGLYLGRRVDTQSFNVKRVRGFSHPLKVREPP